MECRNVECEASRNKIGKLDWSCVMTPWTKSSERYVLFHQSVIIFFFSNIIKSHIIWQALVPFLLLTLLLLGYNQETIIYIYKISGNYHKVNIYFTPGESSLNFSTILLKTTCMKLLLWQTRTAVRLVWLSISFSKDPSYLGLCLLFYKRNGWRIFVKIKPHNKTNTLQIACFIWIGSIRPVFLFIFFIII